MITSIYKGGLGNLLFQIATGYSLAIKNNTSYKINPNLHNERGQGNHITTYLDTIFKKIKLTDYIPSEVFKEKNELGDIQIPYQNDLLLDGFFQKEKYFIQHKAEINKLFGFDSVKLIPQNICTVQVRTGDFLFDNTFNVVNQNYFLKAINFILEQNPNTNFYLVTDYYEVAIKYLPKHIKFNYFNMSEIEDLKLISQSDYSIISNSSFGWWGSFLGKEKITLSPYKWFNSEENTDEIYRKNMIKINF
jgi:hypothetical protein